MKIEKFSWKRSNRGNFPRIPKLFSETGGIWNRGKMHDCFRGDGRPWPWWL